MYRQPPPLNKNRRRGPLSNFSWGKGGGGGGKKAKCSFLRLNLTWTNLHNNLYYNTIWKTPVSSCVLHDKNNNNNNNKKITAFSVHTYKTNIIEPVWTKWKIIKRKLALPMAPNFDYQKLTRTFYKENKINRVEKYSFKWISVFVRIGALLKFLSKRWHAAIHTAKRML